MNLRRVYLSLQQTRIPINFLLINLAVSDTMMAIFFALEYIFSLIFTHPDGVTGTVLCKLLTGGNLAWVGASSSIFTLVFICLERYYALIYPYGGKGKLTNAKLKVIIPISWILAFAFNAPLFLAINFKNTKGDCEEDWPQKWMGTANSMVWLMALTILPLTLMIGFYSRIVYSLWFTQVDDKQLSHRQRAVKLRKRVTTMVIIVSIIFGICWSTDAAFYFLHFISSPLSDVVDAITTVLIVFNSAVNPFVYV